MSFRRSYRKKLNRPQQQNELQKASKENGQGILGSAVSGALDAVDRVLAAHKPAVKPEEIGLATSVGNGIVWMQGLPGLGADELVSFPDGKLGIASYLDPSESGIILLDRQEGISAGQELRRTGKVMSVPVGEALLGRVVDAMGRPLDERGEIRTAQTMPITRSAGNYGQGAGCCPAADGNPRC